MTSFTSEAGTPSRGVASSGCPFEAADRMVSGVLERWQAPRAWFAQRLPGEGPSLVGSPLGSQARNRLPEVEPAHKKAPP